MERQKKDPDAILWRKKGGGSFHANIAGRLTIIKPNQEFWAKEEEIPMAFRDMIVPVDPVAAVKKKEAKEKEAAEKVTAEPKYFLKEKGGNWFDVVNEEGKVQNEKSLRKTDAEALIGQLS